MQELDAEQGVRAFVAVGRVEVGHDQAADSYSEVRPVAAEDSGIVPGFAEDRVVAAEAFEPVVGISLIVYLTNFEFQLLIQQ